MSSKKHFLIPMLLVIMVMILSSCMPGDGTNTKEFPAGFFRGVWHGWLAPISLIMGIFDRNIRIYEVFNNGWAYDFGFYIAIIRGFGSISIFRRKRRR